jgi:predicted N-acyltransferase
MTRIIEIAEHPLYDDFCNKFTDEQRISFVRERRDALLMASDFSQLSDVTVDKEAWAAYRQELRDYMVTYDSSNTNPIFPQKP